MGTLPKQGSVEVVASATPEQVWAVLVDVTRTGEWSHEAVSARWLDGAVGPTPGARFRGRNEQRWARWSRECEVVAAEAPHRFCFRTVPTRLYRDSTLWTFELAPVERGTRITQRYEVLEIHPVLDRLFYAVMRDHRDRTAALRGDLERLATVAAGSTGDPGQRTRVR